MMRRIKNPTNFNRIIAGHRVRLCCIVKAFVWCSLPRDPNARINFCKECYHNFVRRLGSEADNGTAWTLGTFNYPKLVFKDFRFYLQSW